LLILDN